MPQTATPQASCTQKRKSRPRLIVLACLTGLFAWVFADALFGGGMFAFRDAAHFYYPLSEFTQNEWAAGRVPLWNPYENLGMPLAANPAAAVFYPGKLIFALPIPFGWAYTLYILGHVLLAAGAAYLLARRWKATTLAAGCCALSYAFCGNVLIQHCNVIYLVGAAWLPLAMLATDRMLVRRSGRAALGFGAVLAMMVLGGDPQAAYHAGLLAGLYAMVLWCSGSHHGKPRPAVASLPAGRASGRGQTAGDARPLNGLAGTLLASTRGRLLRRRLVLLALAATTGLLLSAVQVLPSMAFSARSGRAVSDVARNVYEIPEHLGREDPGRRIADGLLYRKPRCGTHREHVYHFSVGPWRLAEYVWPNFSGRQYPENRRWLGAIPAEARVWAPSLYMGIFPLLLAIAAMRWRGGRRRDRWLSWWALLAVVAAFGWFAPGWLLHEVRTALGADPNSWPVGAPFGGLYWLMTVLLPGYVQFRYPAKLLVVAALALSLLAARGWDRVFMGQTPRLRPVLLTLAGLSAALAVGVLALRGSWSQWMAGVPPDTLFGPLDTAGARGDLLGGLLQTAVLCGVFWCLLRDGWRQTRWAPAAALVLVALDLAVANGWIVICAPAAGHLDRPLAAALLEREEGRRGGDEQPYRVLRDCEYPAAWQATRSPDRLAHGIAWERDTLFEKYNLTAGVSLARVWGTMMPYDYHVFLCQSLSGQRFARRRGAPTGLDAVGVKYTIESPPSAGPADVGLQYHPRHLPRAWVVERIEVLPPLGVAGPEEIARRTAQVLYPGDRPRDFRRSATVETDLPLDGAPGDRGASEPAPVAAECRVVRHEPLYVEIEAELSRPGLVVLSDQFYPGWQLEVETAGQGTHSVPILRTNRVMRGAWLKAGHHRLVYRYRPARFYWAAATSAFAWLALAVAALLARRPTRPPLAV